MNVIQATQKIQFEIAWLQRHLDREELRLFLEDVRRFIEKAQDTLKKGGNLDDH